MVARAVKTPLAIGPDVGEAKVLSVLVDANTAVDEALRVLPAELHEKSAPVGAALAACEALDGLR